MTGSPELGRAVLELSTDSTSFFADMAASQKATTALKGVFASLGKDLKTLGTNVDSVGQALKTHADTTDKARAAHDSLGASILKTAAGFLSAQAIWAAGTQAFRVTIGLAEDFVKAAGEEEVASARLRAALIQQGTATPSVVAAYQALAEQYQRTTVFSDHLLTSTMGTLAVVGNVMPRDMPKAVQAVTNLASAFGGGEQGLEKATLAVSKAAEGNLTTLQRLGVVVDKTAVQSQGFSVVLDGINAKFGGQAAALAETYTGRVAQLGNAWERTEESVGRIITQNATVLTAFGDLSKILQDASGEMGDNSKAANFVSDALIGGIRAIAGFVSTGGAMVSWGASVGVVLANVGGLAAKLAWLFEELALGIAQLEAHLTLGLATGDRKNVEENIRLLNNFYADVKKANDAIAEVRDKARAGADSWAKALNDEADRLAKTRGQVKPLTDALGENADVWNRHTAAAANNAAALKKQHDAMAALEAEIKTLSGQDVIDSFRTLDAALDTLTNRRITPGGDALEKYRTQAFDAAEALERLGHASEATAARSKALATYLPTSGLAAQPGLGLPQVTGSIQAFLETAPLYMRDWYDTPRLAIPEWTQLGDTLIGVGDNLEGLGRNLSRLQGPAGQLGNALDTVSQAFREIGQLSKIEQKALGSGDEATAQAASTAKWVAGLSAASAIIGQFAQQSKIAAVASSTLSGAASGFMIGGPVGAGIGALVGGIASLFGGGPSEEEQANAQATQNIRQYEEQLLNVAGSLQDIGRIGSAVGVDLQQLWGATGTAGLAAFTAKMKAFQQAEADLIDSIHHGSGVASQALLDLMKAYEQSATDLRKTADQFYADQLAQAEAGVTATIQGIQDAATAEARATALASNLSAGMTQDAAQAAADAITGTVHLAEDQAQGLGASVAGAFAESISRGTSLGDTVKALAPTIATLEGELAASGVSGGAAFALIEKLADAATGTITGPLVTSIEGAGQAIAGFANDGLMSQDIFTGLASTVGQSMSQLEAQGVDRQTVLLDSARTLQEIYELQKAGKLTVDATTQAWLDQAEAQGMVGDKAQSDAEKTVDALQSVASQLGVIADFFTKLLPAAVTQGFETIEQAATHAGGVFDDTFGAQNWWAIYAGVGGTPQQQPGTVPHPIMHEGGIVPALAAGATSWPLGESIARAHTGMLVGQRALRASETPIIAQAGEGILSRNVGMPTLQEWVLNQVNAGRGPGGSGEAPTARAIADEIVRGFREAGIGATNFNAVFTGLQKESYVRDQLIPKINQVLRQGGQLQSATRVALRIDK